MNARTEFIDAMRQAGVACDEPDRIEPNVGVVRFHVEGDRRGSRNGWSALFDDGRSVGGAFGSWRANLAGTWHQRGTRQTSAERVRLRDAISAAGRQRDAELRDRHLEAQQRALRIWESADSADPKHPYLVRKHVNPWDIRQHGCLLLVPVCDIDGALWSLEFISHDGEKRFLRGGRKRGCMHRIGVIEDRVIVAEGYATAATIYEDFSYTRPVVVAFDCGNLLPSARALRERYPDAEISLAADNDIHVRGNPGLAHAQAAAVAVGGVVVVPPDGYCDFNDVRVAELEGAL